MQAAEEETQAEQEEAVAPHHLVLCFRLKVARAANREPQHRPQHTVVMVEKAAQVEQVVLPNTKNPTPHFLRELRITTMYSLMEKVVTAHNSAVEQVGMVLLLAEVTADNMEAAVVLMVAQPELADNMVAKVALVAQKA